MRVAFVPLVGCRVESTTIRDLAQEAPDLRRRGAAVEALPALGLLTLAGQLPSDVEATWHPGRGATDALVQAIVSSEPDLVALSATTASVEGAYALAGRLRQEGLTTVLGGLHATACPDEAARHVDVVACGDGESIWPRILADARCGRLQPRYRRAWSPGPDDWPEPRFALAPPGPGRWTVQTQRGCPFACEFCAASRLLGPPREKPVARVAAELDTLRRLDPGYVLELADDNTFAVRSDPEALLDVLAASGTRWFTEVDWRVGEQRDLPRRMAEAGCVQVLVGLESPVHEHAGMGAKRDSWARRAEAVCAMQEVGLAVHACFIAGSDGETRTTLDQMGELLATWDVAAVQVALETPFPGTALRRRREREGRLLPDRSWRHHTLLDATVAPTHMSVADLEAGFAELVARVHGPEASARRSEVRKAILRRHPLHGRRRVREVMP